MLDKNMYEIHEELNKKFPDTPCTVDELQEYLVDWLAGEDEDED